MCKLTDRKRIFIDALSSLGLKLSDINTVEKIKLNIKNIKEAYKTVAKGGGGGGLNSHSLVLVSVSADNDAIQCYQSMNPYSLFWLFKNGCLYLGDISLNQVDIVDDIKKHLKDYYPSVSTIQIPHHGAYGNWNSDILSDDIKVGILSYGANNYGHPSSRLLENLLLNNVYPYHITENKESIVIQFIKQHSKV